MFLAQVAVGESGRLRAIPFTAISLAFSPANRWTDAIWVFGGSNVTSLPARAVREMIWEGGAAPVAIIDGNARRMDTQPAQGVTTLEPFGALCFIYANNSAGNWQGVSVAVNRGELVIRPHEIDVS